MGVMYRGSRCKHGPADLQFDTLVGVARSSGALGSAGWLGRDGSSCTTRLVTLRGGSPGTATGVCSFFARGKKRLRRGRGASDDMSFKAEEEGMEVYIKPCEFIDIHAAIM